MVYLGIDIGKNNHNASLMDAAGKLLFKGFSFPNTTAGGEKLLEQLSFHSTDPSNVCIGLESTGHYWLALYSFLHEKGFVIHVINPIQTDGWRKGVEIRKRKTDTIDSALIADLIRYGSFVESSLADETLFSLRTLTRFRTYLVDSISDLKRKVICVLDQVFPEYENVFSDVFGSTSKQILLNYTTPAELERLSVDKLAEVLAHTSRNRIPAAKAHELSVLAANSFGVTFSLEAFTFQLRQLVQQMQFIEQQVKDTEAEIKLLLDEMDSPITTIPGIGPTTGAIILSEIGDINRFDSPAKLVAYAGIDASVSKSGQFESTHNVMSKRGSPYLRRAIYQAALVASIHDPVLNAFYLKKRAEGKHHKTCLGAVSRKLCYIIYAVLKAGKPYEVRLPQA
ncbi:MAG: IS110 family transposase [Syntrophomonadaceae bacterium]|nr:IS110 family transposase [Syntrophomonadaceae bacterium]